MRASFITFFCVLPVLGTAVGEVVHDAVQVYAAGMCAHLSKISNDNAVKVMGELQLLFVHLPACAWP